MTAQQEQPAFCDHLDRCIGDTGLPNIQAAHQHHIALDGTASHRLQLLRPPGLQELVNVHQPVMFPAEFLHLLQCPLGANKMLRAEVEGMMGVSGHHPALKPLFSPAAGSVVSSVPAGFEGCCPGPLAAAYNWGARTDPADGAHGPPGLR